MQTRFLPVLCFPHPYVPPISRHARGMPHTLVVLRRLFGDDVTTYLTASIHLITSKGTEEFFLRDGDRLCERYHVNPI